MRMELEIQIREALNMGGVDKVKEKLEEYLENKNPAVDKNQKEEKKEEEKPVKNTDDTDLLMSAEEAYNE